jgi:dihydrodipicolinate synthase/N-acetylneuraminate lyase
MQAHCVVITAAQKATAAETVDMVVRLADELPVPCVYYEVPDVTGVLMTPRQIGSILAHSNIYAIKDSSNNALLAQFLTSQEFAPRGAKLLDGVEYGAAYSALQGYDGVLHGGGVLSGRGLRKIWDAVKSEKIAHALELDRMNSLCLAKIYNRINGPVQNIAGQKYALKLMGVFEHEHTLVDQPLAEADRRRIGAVLDENREWLAFEKVALTVG